MHPSPENDSTKRITTGAEGVEPSVFIAAYGAARGETPAPWETRQPQPMVLAMANSGLIRGAVLDIGCGTGENAIALAARGLRVTAVDFVPAAIVKARTRAAQQLGDGHAIEFAVADALDLSRTLSGRCFETILDSAVFHVFSDADRPRYRASIDGVSAVGTRLLVIAFSPDETREGGPRRVQPEEIEATMAGAWKPLRRETGRYESNIHEGGARAICCVLERIA